MNEFIANITEFIQANLGIGVALQIKLVKSLFVIVFLWLLRFFILRIVWKQTTNAKARYVWRKTSAYISVFLGFLLIGAVWVAGLKQFGTFLGILSAGIAIALKEPLVNIAGWLFIVLKRPFSVGDRIQLGNTSGDVIDFELFAFTVLEIGNWVHADQSTGRIVHIPNGQVFSLSLANYTQGFQYIWHEIPVLITFESDWQKAKEILIKIVNQHAEHLSRSAQDKIRRASRKFMIYYKNLTPIVYTSVENSGVLLTLRYLCEPRRRRSSEEAIWEDILKAFEPQKTIDFAYPTQRFYRHGEKGDVTEGGADHPKQ